MVKRKITKRKGPIGVIKKGKKFQLVFGTKTKPRLGRMITKTKLNELREKLRKKGRKR